jgi:hypothetical protein
MTTRKRPQLRSLSPQDLAAVRGGVELTATLPPAPAPLPTETMSLNYERIR